MAVNAFFRGLPPSEYDGKDPYGNRDLPAGARAAALAADAARALAHLPQPYAGFYARRAAAPLLSLAAPEEEAQAAAAAAAAAVMSGA